MFLIIVAVNEFGDYIGDHPKYYSCPIYCEVKHDHIKSKIKENNNEHTKYDSTIFVQSRDGGSTNKGIEREYQYSNYWGEDGGEDN